MQFVQPMNLGHHLVVIMRSEFGGEGCSCQGKWDNPLNQLHHSEDCNWLVGLPFEKGSECVKWVNSVDFWFTC